VIINEHTSLLKINKHFLNFVEKGESPFETNLRVTTPGKITLHINVIDMINEILTNLKYSFVNNDEYYGDLTIVEKETASFNTMFRNDIEKEQYKVIMSISRYEDKITIRAFGKMYLHSAKTIATEITDYLGFNCDIRLDLETRKYRLVRKKKNIEKYLQ